MENEQKKSIENCLRTFAMMVLFHKEIKDSDIEMCLNAIKNVLG